jgi:hypothetical protein
MYAAASMPRAPMHAGQTPTLNLMEQQEYNETIVSVHENSAIPLPIAEPNHVRPSRCLYAFQCPFTPTYRPQNQTNR